MRKILIFEIRNCIVIVIFIVLVDDVKKIVFTLLNIL